MKLALAMIVKPTDDEGRLLAQCLNSVAPHVDGIYITQAGDKPNEYVSSVISLFGGTESFYQWNNSFADARNFSFAQVPQEYDYIMWLDADDVLRNGQDLPEIIEQNKSVDAFSLWYLYAFDEWKNPIVVHHKTRIIRNDGCLTWVGDLHEDFHANRQVVRKHIEGIDVLHMTDMSRVAQSTKRNVDVARSQQQKLPDDPRSYWNLGNALKADQQYSEALSAFDRFMVSSQSDEEKYIVRLRRAECFWALDQKDMAVDEYRYAIGMKPDYPDAYIALGHLFYDLKRYNDAIPLLKQALILKPPYYSIVVYNPRDYDFTPLKWLAYCYIAIEQPILAYECFKALLQITPKDKNLKGLVSKMKEKAEAHERLLKEYDKLKNLPKDKLKKALDKIPKEFQSHPLVCNLRNVNFRREKSSGKDLAFMCGYTTHEWTPQTALEKGVGGSEEAVIHLAQHFADAGWNVTVYNSCGHEEQKFGKVTYKPFWAFNYRDAWDVVILWRHPKLADYEVNTKKLILDLHDVLPPAELTPQRLKKIDHIFVKSHFHRSLFPAVPDEKFIIAPNGVNVADFNADEERDPYLLINTSSADRSLSALVRLFQKVKARVPEAKCQWAYGWEVYDVNLRNHKDAMEWKDRIREEMKEAGIEELGRLNHKDVAKLYKRARIFAYPTEFAEIDCISARKAQLAGAIPVTTDFGALNETVQFGTKVHSLKNKDTWAQPYQFDFALNNKDAEDAWVEAVVRLLTTKESDTRSMVEWAKSYDWKNIAQKWLPHLK